MSINNNTANNHIIIYFEVYYILGVGPLVVRAQLEPQKIVQTIGQKQWNLKVNFQQNKNSLTY